MFNRLFKAIGLYLIFQQSFALTWVLIHSQNVPERVKNYPNRAKKGIRLDETTEHEHYTVRHSIIDGIERIVYTPKNRRYETPIVMQHGMWHGAWCWESWQRLLAEWGWESHAHSLPGHAQSARQRPVWLCTLDYYLAFYQREIARMERRPVIMGHSMGGALTQWYLKYIGQDVVAAVLVAPWVSHSTMEDGGLLLFQRDPMAVLLSFLQWNANGWVRSPERAAQKLISEGAILSPQQLYDRLTDESILAVMQHNYPAWTPASKIDIPMLILAGEIDQVVTVGGLKKSAKHYQADFELIPNAAHNLMMEHNYESTAQKIHDWLIAQGVE
jgi:pimeloyl-ACP methyl ester carboxylesterase